MTTQCFKYKLEILKHGLILLTTASRSFPIFWNIRKLEILEPWKIIYTEKYLKCLKGCLSLK